MFRHGVQETSYPENVYLSPATNHVVEYQTVHGSADDLTGKGAVNPTATLKAAAAVLEHHGLCRGIEPAMNRAIEAITQRKILHPRPGWDRYHRRAPPPRQPTTFSLSASASQPCSTPTKPPPAHPRLQARLSSHGLPKRPKSSTSRFLSDPPPPGPTPWAHPTATPPPQPTSASSRKPRALRPASMTVGSGIWCSRASLRGRVGSGFQTGGGLLDQRREEGALG